MERYHHLSENEFVSVKDRMPELESDFEYAGKNLILVVKKSNGKRTTIPGRYQRTVIRGKRVERWEDSAGRILCEEVTHWRNYPEPPEED